jgi:hypothetical protein
LIAPSNFDAGFAQLRELVTQGARADAKALGGGLAIAAIFAKRGEDDVALGGGDGGG